MSNEILQYVNDCIEQLHITDVKIVAEQGWIWGLDIDTPDVREALIIEAKRTLVEYPNG